jgi:two-component system, OmpR family, KDP operon response regulator KdpE
VIINNQPVKLTPVEYRMLVLLVKHKDSVVTHKEIVKDVWDTNFQGDTENIRINIRRLRKKLKDNPPNMILSQHGVGYMFKG